MPWTIRCAFLVTLVLLTGAAGVSADVPDVPAAKRLTAVVSTLNTGNVELIREFVASNYARSALGQRSVESRTDTYLQLYGDTGGFVLRSFETSKDNEVSAIAQTRGTEEWYRITCAVDGNKPHGIVGVLFRAIPSPSQFASHERHTREQMVAEVRSYAERMSKRGYFGGVVLLAEGDQVLLSEGYSWRKPNGDVVKANVNDRFRLASINKVFTAVAVAQLAEQKKLAFSDPISKYLADFPKQRGETITIAELLTHTAGMEPFLDEASFDAMRSAKLRTRADEMRFLGTRPAVSAPGEKFVYSNAGFMVLEGVVEAVSGEGMEEYLERQVFAPAGMSATGQGMATAADLARFAQALTGGKLMRKETLAEITKPRVATDDDHYGYGFEVHTIGDVRIVGHAGGGPSISNQLDIYPGKDLTLVVLSSRPGNTAQRIANRLREMMSHG